MRRAGRWRLRSSRSASTGAGAVDAALAMAHACFAGTSTRELNDQFPCVRSHPPAPRDSRSTGEGRRASASFPRLRRCCRRARREEHRTRRRGAERIERRRCGARHVRAAPGESRHRRLRDRGDRRTMKFGIVTFPGSNCDYDAFRAVTDVLGQEAVYLWHKAHDLEGADVIILPGGFSYGDYLRAGAIARFSPIMREVVAHATRGGPVLGICNGFQIACEADLLPGALMRN